ncbi:hypothetical protein [Proteus penneri]|uniref:hypothetical protein n=1 Tax=Proteus penneri TaxID=102862 RepID=UPI0021004534|nr:hypothetical protein [Proteus penneri]
MEIYYQPPKKFKGNPTPVIVKKVNSNSFKARKYARYASFRANKLKEEEIAKANSVKEKTRTPLFSLSNQQSIIQVEIIVAYLM